MPGRETFPPCLAGEVIFENMLLWNCCTMFFTIFLRIGKVTKNAISCILKHQVLSSCSFTSVKQGSCPYLLVLVFLDIQFLTDEARIEKNLDAFPIDLCLDLILQIVVCINSSVHQPLAKPFCTTYFLFEIGYCKGLDFGLVEGFKPYDAT